MPAGRIISTGIATATVAGCALLVVGMGRAEADRAAAPVRIPASTLLVPAQLAPQTRVVTPVRAVASKAAPTAAAQPSATLSVVHGSRLPLPFKTHKATRVITVVASSPSSTTATLQAWHKVGKHRWAKTGKGVLAHVGSDGLSKHPSESKSATPIGSFTLTRAFGRLADPGTKLHYFKTTPADWWISQSGPLYNTHQRCSSNCKFRQGAPNEHLYYETPYYNYAVVIDYNTRNAPGGVKQGAGSAFFLHVSVGQPTAGCVAVRESKVKALLRWLKPSTHPRILIGVR